MTAQLTARFDSRDAADLALMRLRRSGVPFTVGGLTVGGAGAGAAIEAFSPYPVTMTNQLGAMDPAIPHLGARALMARTGGTEGGSALLQLRLPAEALPRAREIIRTALGRDIRTAR